MVDRDEICKASIMGRRWQRCAAEKLCCVGLWTLQMLIASLLLQSVVTSFNDLE
jgi:hypothetical protein